MIVASHRLNLRLTRPGTLLPWLGPALRGLVARQFKERVCRHPADQRRNWEHCTGCPHLTDCPYGQTYEPDPPAGVQMLPHEEEAARPLVLAPYFPVPAAARPGLEVPLRVTIVGPAARHSSPLLAALAEAGRGGFGEEHVGFDLVETVAQPEVRHLRAEDLPSTPDTLPGILPRVGVGLTAPLFLSARDDRGRRRPVERPEFNDLFRAALRSVGRLFACCDRPLRADWSALKMAAGRVRMVEHCYEPFWQPRFSSRSGARYELRGVAGGGVYSDVPLALVPWLVWGGRLHAGTYRVHGAGGWRLVLD